MHQIITQASIEDDKIGKKFSRPNGSRQAWSATIGKRNFSPSEDPEKIVSTKMSSNEPSNNILMDKQPKNSSSEENSTNQLNTVSTQWVCTKKE